MSLEGKLILITGSARGIGRSMAEHFLKSGAAVVLSDILAEELDATVEALAAEYGADKVSGYPCNVSDEESVVGMFKAMGDDGKFIDTAILNAGILRDGLLVKTDRETGEVIREMSLAQWKLVIDVNLTGVFLTGREAAKLMIKGKKKGVIINMSSIARHGNFGQTNYAATKAGVAAMAVVWSKELSRFGIRAAAIAPGLIATPMVLRDMKQSALDRMKKMIPIGRLGRPEEVARTAEFIITNEMVNGVTVEISGGFTF